VSTGPPLAAIAPLAPWSQHPTLKSLQPSLQITADCWALLAAPDGSSRKEQYLPKGEREPDTSYRKRVDAARPSGFCRDALRTYAGAAGWTCRRTWPTCSIPNACSQSGVFGTSLTPITMRETLCSLSYPCTLLLCSGGCQAADSSSKNEAQINSL
jgi:hypothetical protein